MISESVASLVGVNPLTEVNGLNYVTGVLQPSHPHEALAWLVSLTPIGETLVDESNCSDSERTRDNSLRAVWINDNRIELSS